MPRWIAALLLLNVLLSVVIFAGLVRAFVRLDDCSQYAMRPCMAIWLP